MNMKYYDIHVDYDGTKDGDGYSIFIGYSSETDKYFARACYTQMVSMKKAYLIKPCKEEEFVPKLAELMKQYKDIPFLHDGLCGTDDSHQKCIRVIAKSINPDIEIGEDEILEFHTEDLQFACGRHALSKAMMANEYNITVEAMLDEYYSNHEVAYEIYEIVPLGEILFERDFKEPEKSMEEQWEY